MSGKDFIKIHHAALVGSTILRKHHDTDILIRYELKQTYQRGDKIEYLGSNRFKFGLGVPMMLGDTRDDISKASSRPRPSPYIYLFIALI